MSFYLQCLIGGSLGLLFYVFVVKLPAFKKRAKAANISFNPLSYFKDDWDTLIGSFLSILIVLFVFQELVGIDARIVKVARILFVAVGYSNTSIVHKWLSKTEKAINTVIDTKTNIADQISPRK
jgi:hypothetical protein